MRRSTIRISLVGLSALALLAATSDVFAQRGPGRGRGGGGGGWGRGSQYAQNYDPQTVETLEGTVESIDYHTPKHAPGRGVHAVLKTADETIDVHLGPEWFVENQDTQIEKGDQVQVTGSRVTYEDKPALIAAEIVMGDDVLELRDEEGFPRWAGWRQRGRGPGSGGWGPGSAYNRQFDPKTVETLSGEIKNIHYHTPRDGRGRGVHAILKTDKETIEIHLGPRWFIDKQDVQIEAHDQVTVTGSRIEYHGKPAVIAVEIQKGDDVLDLRDKDGIPRWAAGRRVKKSRTE